MANRRYAGVRYPGICRAGHDLDTVGKTEHGYCLACKRLSNDTSIRLRRGDRWINPPKPVKSRQQRWATVVSGMKSRIARVRAIEGFNSRHQPWTLTLGDPSLYEPVNADEMRRSA